MSPNHNPNPKILNSSKARKGNLKTKLNLHCLLNHKTPLKAKKVLIKITQVIIIKTQKINQI